jgi:hypothetical protein
VGSRSTASDVENRPVEAAYVTTEIPRHLDPVAASYPELPNQLERPTVHRLFAFS